MLVVISVNIYVYYSWKDHDSIATLVAFCVLTIMESDGGPFEIQDGGPN